MRQRTGYAGLLIVAGLLVAGVLGAAEVIPEEAVPAKTILPTRKYNGAVVQAQEKYELELKRARLQYLRDLEAAKLEYMKARDLPGANATQALADAIAQEESTQGRSWLRMSDGRIGELRLGAEGAIEGGRRTRWSSWVLDDGTLTIDGQLKLRRHYVPMYVGVDEDGEPVYLVPRVMTPLKASP